MGFTGAYFGRGSGPIHLDHIVCSGTEYNLTDCETGTGTRQSSHSEDLGVKCNTSKPNNNSIESHMCCDNVVNVLILYTAVDENYRNGDVRLVGGPYNWEGRLEIFLDGEWGTILSASWNNSHHAAQIVCEQLGLPAEG